MSGRGPVAIVQPDARTPEQWFALATLRASRPGWYVLASRGNRYREVLPRAGGEPYRTRSQALDETRKWVEANRETVERLYPNHLFIPVNFSVAVEAARPGGQDRPSYFPLFPTRMPLCGSYDEACGRVRVLLGADPGFAERWGSFRFVPVKVDDVVHVMPKEWRLTA